MILRELCYCQNKTASAGRLPAHNVEGDCHPGSFESVMHTSCPVRSEVVTAKQALQVAVLRLRQTVTSRCRGLQGEGFTETAGLPANKQVPRRLSVMIYRRLDSDVPVKPSRLQISSGYRSTMQYPIGVQVPVR